MATKIKTKGEFNEEDKFNCDIAFIAISLAENCINKIGDKFQYGYRQNFKKAKENLEVLNNLVNKNLDEVKIEDFDSDVDILKTIIRLDREATIAGKNEEFINHLKKFFDGKIN